MKTIETKIIQTSLGELILGTFDNKLCLCNWTNKKNASKIENRFIKYLNAGYSRKTNDVLELCEKQIHEFLQNKRESFDLPLLFVGTPFQKNVWNALLQIPYSKTISYKDLASKINCKKSFRAVANANGANAMSIIVPCHRVIASDGTLGGYAGGIDKKIKLLELEK